jgi:uncharacterized protein (TIGR02996 family)
MASMIAMLEEHDELVPGSVLPIDRYLTNPRALTEISHGGTLYLVASGPKQELFLVAALEQPERSQLRKSDTRPDGWYGPENVVPVTNISKLRKVLKLTKARQAKLVDNPFEITKAQEAELRASFDEADAPVLETAPTPGTDLAGAIAALLVIWQRTHAVDVADLIDRATRLLPHADHPLLESYGEDVSHERWMRVWNDESARAIAMPRLLQNLFIQWNRRVEERLLALASTSPDPRVARQLARRVQEVNELEKAKHVVALVRAAPDGTAWNGIAGMIEELVDHYGTARRDAYAFTRDQPATSKLTEDEQARVAAIAEQIAPLEADRTEWELVDAIAEHPDDDGPYLVYADWLQNRQHPRGEYIALTCQKRTKGLSAALSRRLAALENIPYLAGPIDDLATTRRRPNPRGIDRDLDAYWTTTGLMWREAARHPLTGAIRKLTLIGMHLERPHRMSGIAAFAQAAPRLQRIEGLTAKLALEMVNLLGPDWRLVGRSVVRR